jgi:hypothetical protein
MAKRPLDYNWAKDEDFANVVKINLLDILKSVKVERQEREDRWQTHYRAWSLDQSGADRSYSGMANLTVPQIRKEVETMSRRIYKGLLPEDYLKAEPPKEAVYEDLTEVNTQVLRHYFDNKIRVKSVFMPWIKQGVLYGTSPIRSFWHKEVNEMLYKKRVPVLQQDGTFEFESQVTQEDIVLYDAPKLRTEDLFTTWVYPFNASRPEDIEITFWETKVKKSELESKNKRGLCHGFEHFKESGKDKDFAFEESQERLAQFGESGMFLAIQNDTLFNLTEIYCKLILPDTNKPVSCVIEIIDGCYISRIQRNPYWHQQAPFDWMRFIIPPPGEFYGRGLPEAGISLQHQLNDTMNQTMDSATLRLNNITIINPAYAPNSESFEIEPGARWWADPNAVKQFEFPDLSESGYRAAGNLRGMISEMSDNSPQLPDPIAGKARSTGQAELAINEWQTDLFTFIDFISNEALSSMAFKVHSLIQQFISNDDVIRVAGKYAGTWLERVITPDQIVGHYIFKWMGALQIENQAIKTNQILNLLKIYPTLPPEAQQQIKMNWTNIMIKVVRDGFQIRDVENIITTDRLKASTPADIEEKIINQNGMIQVNVDDDDEMHMRIHMIGMTKDKDLYRRSLRARHIEEHKVQLQNKVQAQQMAMEQLKAQIAPPETKGIEGNVAQIPESTNMADLERGIRS